MLRSLSDNLSLTLWDNFDARGTIKSRCDRRKVGVSRFETSGPDVRLARASNDLRFEIYSTDESGSLNKSLKFWAAGDFCRKLVFVFVRDKKAKGKNLY